MIRGYIEPNHGRGKSSKSRLGRRRRQEMFDAQQGLCHWCKDKMQMNPLKITEKGNTACNSQFATFEHMIPKSAGGLTCRSNLVLAHAKCNNKRHKMKWPHDPFYSIRANRMAHYEKQFSKQKKQLETENELGIDRTIVGLTDNELA